ncbi:hypothetical protein SAMN02745446_01973 [Desulfococcus multivorans DSM 2059]|nr:hypothetical protein SAMN02745446_01973 [Desulfococcus multivorans DSM 2059]
MCIAPRGGLKRPPREVNHCGSDRSAAADPDISDASPQSSRRVVAFECPGRTAFTRRIVFLVRRVNIGLTFAFSFKNTIAAFAFAFAAGISRWHSFHDFLLSIQLVNIVSPLPEGGKSGVPRRRKPYFRDRVFTVVVESFRCYEWQGRRSSQRTDRTGLLLVN